MIRQVGTTRVQLPLRETFRTAIRETDTVEALRVQIDCEDGRIGVGYGTATPAITGDTLDSMERHIATIGRETVIGHEIAAELFETVRLFTPLSKSGTAALDLALHDASQFEFGQVTPSHESTSVRTSVTISAGTADDMVAACIRRLELGFSTLKLKLGLDPTRDIDRLQRVVAAVAGRAEVWVDANQGWGTAAKTLRLMEQADALGCLPAMLEQPVEACEHADLSAIAERLRIPVFADESVQTIADIERLADFGGHVDGVNIKFMKFGGLTGSTQAAHRAHELGFNVLVGSMMEHPSSVAVAVRFAATLREPIHDLDAGWWFTQTDPLRYENSYVFPH